MKNTNKLIKAADEFPEHKGHLRTGCSSGFIPFLWHRHQLNRKAKGRAEEVVNIQNKELGNVSHQKPLSENAKFRSTSYEELDSRNRTMNGIMEALKDPNVKMIGVYGPGGVEQLADMLVLNFDEESVTGRAARLFQRLTGNKDNKKNVLVILDDLWAVLDLRDLGIPSGNEPMEIPSGKKTKEIPSGKKPKENHSGNKPMEIHSGNETMEIPSGTETMEIPSGNEPREFHSGNEPKEIHSGIEWMRCKILLSSRNKDVLSKMDVKDKSDFELEGLKEIEAEKLFQKVAGIDENDKTYGELAADAAKKCGGLPVAIVAVASALKNKSLPQWKAALEQIERNNYSRDLIDAADRSIKLGYDYLESEELKSIFLLCSRMGHDPLIKDLVNYSLGLSLFQGVYSIKEAEHKVDESITKLIDLGLLEDSYSSDRFTMHDIVRHVAMLIASKDHQVFALSNRKLSGWPDKDEIRNCTAISLHNSDIGDELPEGFDCPRLKVLHLDSNDPYLRIPDKFFEGMGEMKVLVLTGLDLTSLPSSIKFLTSLRMLRLERCELGDISVIGNLKNVRILNLSGSRIKELPREMGQLGQLQLLDLSNCSRLEVIPPNVISRFKYLQELYLDNSFRQWEAKEQASKTRNASIAELRDLHQLRALNIQISDTTTLPGNLFFDKLERYKILVGHRWRRSDASETRTLMIDLHGSTDVHLLNGIKKLFKQVAHLFLRELNGILNVVNELNWKAFPHLKYMDVGNNDEIQYILSSKERKDLQNSFPELEELYLENLIKLEAICYGLYTEKSFSRLKRIRVEKCDQLKKLFSCSMVEHLTQLEAIDVSKCMFLEESVLLEEKENSSDNDEADKSIKFPQLRELKLQCLPALGDFYNNRKTSTSSRLTENQKTEILQMNAEDEKDSSVPLFDNKACMQVTIFPNLKEISVEFNSNLTRIWPNKCSPESFGQLQSCIVQFCEKIDTIFPSYMSGKFHTPIELRISGCNSLKKIFDVDIEQTHHPVAKIRLRDICLIDLSQLEHIWNKDLQGTDLDFRNLRSVTVVSCNCLGNIFPLSVAKPPGLVQLEHLDVIPKLEKLIVRDKNAKWIMRDNYSMGLFCNLKSIEIYEVDEEEFPYWFLHRTPNLERLNLSDSSFKVLFPSGSVAVPEIHTLTVVQLRRLRLLSLPNLEYICKEGFQLDPVLQMLEYLEVVRCSSLTNLVPSSVSFNHLTFLTVFNCNRLTYLIASSTAKSLAQLITMRISFCQVIEQIVLKEEGDEREDEIVFRQLRTLEIIYLINLGSFSASNIVLKFPLLEELVIEGCPSMQIFSGGVLSMPKLQQVHLPSLSTDKRDWGGDLNGTIQKSFIDKVIKVCDEEELQLSYYPWLKEIWQPKFPLPDKLLCNLKSLVVYKCEFLPNSILLPSHLLISLNNLEKLEVRNCNSVEVIFDVKGINEVEMRNEGPAFRLKTLTLDQLPNLEHVWNKDPQETLIFEILQEVNVNKCERLKNLFPASVARNLPQLEKLEVKDSGLQQIVSKDDATDNIKFVFHHLTTLILWNLPKLENFYPGSHTLEWLMLKEIDVYGCDELVMFSSKSQSYNNGRRSLVSAEQVFSNLEKLSLDKKETNMILHGQFEPNLLHKLKSLKFHCFLAESDCFPIGFLQKVPNLEILSVSDCSFEELFPSAVLDVDFVGKHAKFRRLELNSLRKLKSIVTGN
ncbi:Disease resistance protein family [Quillaja saponaria]|uniref:Disease resistance protein family n=1 Tax=Quillaja saponaria TaxID=32244 RepID=A0AAD7L3U8_QUISA|nr:Disease resistance protein family [Quillaja saponaria]